MNGQVFTIGEIDSPPHTKTQANEIDPEYKVDTSQSDISADEKRKLEQLISEFHDVFSKSQYNLGVCKVEPQKILTTTEILPKSRILCTSIKYKEQIKKHLEQLIQSGVLVESDTPWVSSLVIIQKDRNLRPCIDFCKLNEITIPDYYLMPRMDTILNCRYYTSLDMASGYMQIPLDENASRKCGVILMRMSPLM